MSLGMGVMIRQLCGDGGKSLHAYELIKGQTITSIRLVENEILLSLPNEKKVKITDEGQSCCEHRYITTDDDLPYYDGAVLHEVELGEYKSEDSEYDDSHDIQFLELRTSKGVVTFATHNEHNGYYGGFAITLNVV
jgi:hypothetical protein